MVDGRMTCCMHENMKKKNKAGDGGRYIEMVLLKDMSSQPTGLVVSKIFVCDPGG